MIYRTLISIYSSRRKAKVQSSVWGGSFAPQAPQGSCTDWREKYCLRKKLPHKRGSSVNIPPSPLDQEREDGPVLWCYYLRRRHHGVIIHQRKGWPGRCIRDQKMGEFWVIQMITWIFLLLRLEEMPIKKSALKCIVMSWYGEPWIWCNVLFCRIASHSFCYWLPPSQWSYRIKISSFKYSSCCVP